MRPTKLRVILVINRSKAALLDNKCKNASGSICNSFAGVGNVEYGVW